MITETQLRSRLPFLEPGTIMFISSGNLPEVDCCVGENLAAIRRSAADSGHRFVYLPEVLGRLPEGAINYLFPGTGAITAAEVQELILSENDDLRGRTGLVCADWGGSYFYEFGPEDAECVTLPLIADCIAAIPHRRVEVHFKLSNAPKCECECLPDYLPIEGVPVETPLDARAQKILREISRIQEEFGISIEELDVILNYSVRLSHLHITPAGRIFLSDFDNAEVKLDDLSKAVFFLYLKHPEGISYFDLPDHRSELLRIYLKLTGKDDMDAIEKSIDNLVNRYDNSINVKVSRIKAAFKSVVNERVAQFYYIDGPQGGTKKIPVDRNLVIWER